MSSSDYSDARRHFRDAALRAGCAHESHGIAARGPDGEELSIDVAIRRGGREDASVVVSSGLHGVEAPIGSAIQTRVLDGLRESPDDEPDLILIHALNPFGFAWRRRVNEDNVDLNRNFLDEAESFRGAPPRYAVLDNLLNPTRPPSRWEPVPLKFALAVARHGMPALKLAVASGQYDFSRGLFFGGHAASRTSDIVRANLLRWLGGARDVVHLDVHTGLGAYGACTLFPDEGIGAAERERLERRFHGAAFAGSDPAGVAYPARGGFGPWCRRVAGDRRYAYAMVEFGTYPPARMLAGLRAENQAHHWSRADAASTAAAKSRLADLFCPRSEAWRQRAIDAGVRLVGDALTRRVAVD